MTNRFFLKDSTFYAFDHKILFAVALFDLKLFVILWPLLCLVGPVLYFGRNSQELYSARGIIPLIPFLFSFISATWLVAGTFDLKLLGYGREWSYYAAIHGAFLGWILLGCFAHLARTSETPKPYFAACLLAPVFFLLVAFGIDGVPFIKRIGVIGLAVLIPGMMIFFAKGASRRAALLAWLSVGAIAASMLLALGNEFWLAFPRAAYGLPTMVLLHGTLNGLVAVPLFLWAVWRESSGVKKIG
jgi:hypothetical protein